MEPVHRIIDKGADSTRGKVVYDIPKLLWNVGMIACAVILAPLTFNFSSLILFISFTYLSLLIGHSVGMHRLMIHQSFSCPTIIEKILIYIGVLVGMSGPFGIIKIHDLRDWAQRQPECHSFFSHTQGYFRDLWWQLTCNFKFEQPPAVNIEKKYADDNFYQWLEATWRYHQLLLAIILYFTGGWSFVIWGVFLRVSVSIIGHWSITYFCHNPGPGTWHVKKASVQASNLPGLGLITYGECWHNNHHAFPESARIGIEKGQADPAWCFIKLLKLVGLASNIGKPRTRELRGDLQKKT